VELSVRAPVANATAPLKAATVMNAPATALPAAIVVRAVCVNAKTENAAAANRKWLLATVPKANANARQTSPSVRFAPMASAHARLATVPIAIARKARPVTAPRVRARIVASLPRKPAKSYQ